MSGEDGTPILDLPAELLHLIFAFLEPGNDVLSTRMVCSVFAKIGEDYLPTEVATLYKRDRMQRLLEIAAHEKFSKRVDSLYLQADRFGYVKSFKEWNKHREEIHIGEDPYRAQSPEIFDFISRDLDNIDQRAMRAYRRAHQKYKALRKGQYTKQQLRDAYQTYRDAVTDQVWMSAEGFDRTCLATFFQKCPNLRQVTLATMGEQRDLTMSRSAWKDCMYYPGFDEDALDCGVLQFERVIEALCESECQLKSLAVFGVSYYIFEDHMETSIPCADVMASVQEFRLGLSLIMDELKVPRFSFEADHVLAELTDYCNNGILHTWLAAAPQLRVLKLRMYVGGTEHPIADTQDIIGDFEWPCLEELGLEDFLSTEDHLVDLILRHRNTLTRLCLTHIDLLEGDWDSVFQRIAGKLPKLRHVKLRHYLKEWGSSVFDFDVAGGESRRIDMIRDAVHNMILNGGELPDYEALERHPNNGQYPWTVSGYEPPHRDGDTDYPTMEDLERSPLAQSFDELL